MLHFQINPNSGLPVYRQLINQMKHYLASGALRGGDRLPSVREMAKTLAVNPNTVVKAYTEMEHEGILENKQGRGAFITDKSPQLPETERRRLLQELTRQFWVEASQLYADETLILQVVEEERLRLRQERQQHSQIKS